MILTAETVDAVKSIVNDKLISENVQTVLVIDGAGNILAHCGQDTDGLDAISLAALTAANFGATSQIAKLIGENDFSLLYHKGEKANIHFARLGGEMILVSIFGDDVSLGLVRVRVDEIAEDINKIFEQ
ncbi:MAG: roadblock/LC7 domain-containing protein [Proteobacteria bacterium]|nr:roadblock/LC7 domain-containing protein [Pseudomonadota bacterium]MBU1640771.1 roadblock/LC7 domain-containing protein [Pseudomonadota bacterium]